MFTYHQSTGVIEQDGIVLGTGYSGFGPGKNNPSDEKIPGTGPVPQGRYTIGQSFPHPHLGPISMRLIPDGSHTMYGRSGFLIHGDSSAHPGAASHGCIVLGPTIRTLISKSRDRVLMVIA